MRAYAEHEERGGDAEVPLPTTAGENWQRAAIDAEPRSAYLLAGTARTEREHSIPAVERLRYSITFRNFQPKA